MVRDFFVLETDAHDIDIWFTSLPKKDRFVEKLRTAGVEIKASQFGIHKKFYPFTVSQIIVKFPNGHLYFVDLVVSGNYPVNDFDVNDLIWDGTVKHYTGNQEKANQVMRAISKKTMTMKPGYVPVLKGDHADTSPYVVRIEKFKKRGWFIVE